MSKPRHLRMGHRPCPLVPERSVNISRQFALQDTADGLFHLDGLNYAPVNDTLLTV